MDRNEKLQYQQSIENFFEEKKVYDLLEKLFRDLIVNKPKDPIEYLIKRIKKPDSKRIFITGSAGTDRKELALSVSNHFNFHCISLGDLIQKEISKKIEISRKIENKAHHFRLIDDEIIIDLLRKEIIKLEKENSSYVVEGFPRNRVQAMFLQTVGLMPDNIICLDSSRKKVEERIHEKLRQIHSSDTNYNYEKSVKESVDESDLNLKAVKEVFKGFYAEIPTSNRNKSNLIDEIARIIKFKNKTNAARKPPKILLLGPPCSRKSDIARLIAQKYNICHVSTSELLNKEIRMNNDNSPMVLNHMNSGDLVPDKIVFKLLEDRLYSSDCMINGWILTGFPKNTAQMYYLENNINNIFKASLTVIVDMDDEFSTKRAGSRRIDPTTGNVYYLDSRSSADINAIVKQRLAVKTEDKKDVLNKRLDNWKKLSNVILNQNMGNNILRLNGESSLENLVESISDAMENAS